MCLPTNDVAGTTGLPTEYGRRLWRKAFLRRMVQRAADHPECTTRSIDMLECFSEYAGGYQTNIECQNMFHYSNP